MVKMAICGACGKMGRVIANIISQRDDCETIAGIDVITEKYSDFPIVPSPNLLTEKPDVIIDFSSPLCLDGLLSYSLTNNVAVVFATTGYSSEQIEKIKSASSQIPVFFTFNMSLGINLLVELAKKAKSILGEQFDIEIVEKHHNQKIDAPSGTAIMLAEALNEENDCNFVYDRHSKRVKRDKKEIGIHSIRGGTIVGQHEVIFAGRDETITLAHEATSKEVFAVGAVNAGVFLKGKKSGLYEMSDLLDK